MGGVLINRFSLENTLSGSRINTLLCKLRQLTLVGKQWYYFFMLCGLKDE
jgi:hypothetical protein